MLCGRFVPHSPLPTGSIPRELARMKSLRSLNLRVNKLSGEFRIVVLVMSAVGIFSVPPFSGYPCVTHDEVCVVEVWTQGRGAVEALITISNDGGFRSVLAEVGTVIRPSDA